MKLQLQQIPKFRVSIRHFRQKIKIKKIQQFIRMLTQNLTLSHIYRRV